MSTNIFSEPKHFEAIFHEAAIGIIVTNASFEMILSNDYAQKLFGYSGEELLGQNISILIPNHLKGQHEGHLSKINHKPVSRPMGVGLELKAKRKDESLFPIEISLSHFKTDEQMFYIAFVSDVTLKRKVEMELILRNQEINQLNETLEAEVEARTQALQNTLEQLELQTKELEHSLQKEIELGDLKTRFVSMASHEFRTPLTSILSSASLIEKYSQSADQPKRSQHIQRIKSSVAHLTEILEEFLSVGKLESGKVEVRPDMIMVEEFLTDLVTEVDGMRRPGQHINLTIESNLYDFVSDTSMLRKVLLNGLSNALKFSQKDVFLKASLHQQDLFIEIIDQGIGISEADQKHLFERFFRGGNANVIPGTGLGLHLMDRYMRLLGGELKLRSEMGLGTTLTIQIPRLNYAN
ncbi:MAG: PAS domain-containing sensor histidine kinase [Bacteroidota bacterium]